MGSIIVHFARIHFMQIQLQSIKTPCRRLVLEVKLGHECVYISSIVDIIQPHHDMKVRVWTMGINTWLVY
jgi:hypothetical protein